MENAVVSQTSLFWNKLGKWQVLAVILTLAIFFFALYSTRDKEKAIFATFVFAIFVAIFSFFCFVFLSARFVTVLAAFGSATFVFAALAEFGFVFLSAHHFATAVALVAVALVAVALIAITIFAINEAAEHGIQKRVVWLSFTAEWVCISLPVLLA